MSHSQELLDIRMAIAEAMFDREGWSIVLEKIGRHIGAYTGHVFILPNDPAAGNYQDVITWGPNPAEEAQRFAIETGRQDPWAEGAVRKKMVGSGDVRTGQELCPDADWRYSPWSTFRARQGIDHLLTYSSRPPSRGDPASVSFLKRGASGEFDAEAKALLTDLARDLGRATNLFMQHRRAVRQVAQLEEALLAFGEILWILDGFGRIEWQSREAENVLRARRFLGRSSGWRLDFLGRRGDLESLIAGAIAGANLEDAFWDLDGNPWRVRAFPVRRNEGTRVALAIDRVERQPRLPSITLLQKLYEVSQSEAEVALGLAAGYKVPDLARQRNVAVTTVRAQLASVFSKMGVASQADVVRAIMRLSW